METIIIAVVLAGMAGGIYGLHRLGMYLDRQGIIQYWNGPAGSGGGYNPLQEMVQPQARHVVQVQEQRFERNREGDPRDPHAMAD